MPETNCFLIVALDGIKWKMCLFFHCIPPTPASKHSLIIPREASVLHFALTLEHSSRILLTLHEYHF